jgi:hypothetical protein
MNLHGQIMNLPAKAFAPGEMNDAAYGFGHRDARHAAAELALKADALATSVSTLIDHLERMNCLTREEEPFVAAVRDALGELVSG